MNNDLLILILEAMVAYFLVLWSHSMRHRFGLAHFYALIGGITAVMTRATGSKSKCISNSAPKPNSVTGSARNAPERFTRN